MGFNQPEFRVLGPAYDVPAFGILGWFDRGYKNFLFVEGCSRRSIGALAAYAYG